MTDKNEPTSQPDKAPATAAEGNAAAKGNKNAVWMGTAVGVGSAALVAALMYANRRTKKG